MLDVAEDTGAYTTFLTVIAVFCFSLYAFLSAPAVGGGGGGGGPGGTGAEREPDIPLYISEEGERQRRRRCQRKRSLYTRLSGVQPQRTRKAVSELQRRVHAV